MVQITLFGSGNSPDDEADKADEELGKHDPEEANDLPLHTRRCALRYTALRRHVRAVRADMMSRSDRNFRVLLFIVGLLILKGVIDIKMLATLFGL